MNNYPYATSQPIQRTTSYSSDGTPIKTDVYEKGSLGANFSGLIGNNVTVNAPGIIEGAVPADKKGRKKKSKTDKDETITKDDGLANSQKIVENTVYADTYMATNEMAYNIINQTDQLLSECKQDLEFIRRSNMKGKFHYMNATMTSMGTLLSTKLAAIKEINNTIKNVNDNEYRRFKDFRAMNSTDDNTAVMAAYNAFISAPVGAPEYLLPNTQDITGSLNGVVRADLPSNIQGQMDAGLANYLANLTPEENYMINENNPNYEEVLLFDQSTGMKKFQWIDKRTNQPVPNMPTSTNLILEDFVIDPRTNIAKNTNLNMSKRVVMVNSDETNKF